MFCHPASWHFACSASRAVDQQLTPGRGVRLAAVAAGVGGALLFLWSIRTAGVAGVRDGVGRVGWWFAAICRLGGVRYLVRAAAWRMCLDDPQRLPLGVAFGAAVMGDALGNVTPFGVLISEPSKVAFVKRRTAGPRDLGGDHREPVLHRVCRVLFVAAQARCSCPSTSARCAVRRI